MNEPRINEILIQHKEILKNTAEALRLAGMPESLIVYNLINLPDLEKLLPEDVVKFYSELKTMIV